MITKEMTVREVTQHYPETISIFGEFKVDFCCGGGHSIEQTARACGVSDLESLLWSLNQVIAARPHSTGRE